GHDGDDAGSYAAEEEEDHQHHQYEGLDHRLVNGINGALNKDRTVVGHLQCHPRRQVLVDQLDFAAHFAGEVQRISGGLFGHPNGETGLAVETRTHSLISRAKPHLRNFAHTYGVAVYIGHHDVLELLHSLQVCGRHH